MAFFLTPESAPPYGGVELQLAAQWVGELIKQGQPLCQGDLSKRFNELSPSEDLRLDTRTAWLDAGWFATPEPVREAGYSVSVILPEDEKACRQSGAEIIRRAVPMNYSHRMKHWPEFKGHLLAPQGAIAYDTKMGAVLL